MEEEQRNYKGHFKITSVHRDDLEHLGFNTEGVDDSTMEQLAGKLADDYCTQLFWDSLKVIAEDYFCIPKREDEDKK